jgi:hypothetical protein
VGAPALTSPPGSGSSPVTLPDAAAGEDPRPPITGIVVTRGDVDLSEILESLESLDQVIVWENGYGARELVDGRLMPSYEGRMSDVAVYGRYLAIEWAAHDLIYVQDDDCIVPVEGVIATALQPGFDLTRTIVANMPESRWRDYPDSCLVGWGSVFHRDLPGAAFRRFSPDNIPAFYRECDVVFTVLTPSVKVDAGFRHLPWAEDPARAMFKRPDRAPERARVYELARAVRDAR